MKAARIHGYGAEPVMEDVPVLEAGLDQVLVRVKAAGLNPLDVKLHSGVMHGFFPLAVLYTLGTDLNGIVRWTGVGVTGWQASDAVVARLDPTSGGAVAEVVLLPTGYLAAALSGQITMCKVNGWQNLAEKLAAPVYVDLAA